MKTAKAQTPKSADAVENQPAEAAEAAGFSNPLKLLKTPRSWCHPQDLVSVLEQRLTEDGNEDVDFQQLNEAHFAFCSPDELALALAFAVEDWLPAWMSRDKVEARMLKGNQALLDASEAPPGSARQARLLTETLEAWHSESRPRHLHQINCAVYEMMGIAVNEATLQQRAQAILEGVFQQFLVALPTQLGLRHILFLHSLDRFAPATSAKLLAEHEELVLFQEHLRSVGDFLKLSSWLLEMPHFVRNGPEDADETQCLLDTAQDCRADLECWADQAVAAPPSAATQREIRTRLALISLVLALRSRMWQDAAALVENYRVTDLREEKDEAATQTLIFAIELVPLIARHQYEPRENLAADLEEARSRLPLVTELINELEECFLGTPEDDQTEPGTPATLEDAVPRVRCSQLHAMPMDPMPVSKEIGDLAEDHLTRQRVMADLMEDVISQENEEHQRKLREELNFKPRPIRSRKSKSRSARKTRKILGKRMATFAGAATGTTRGHGGNHRRNVAVRTLRQARRKMEALGSAKLTALAAGFAFLAVTGILVTLGLTGNPSVDRPQIAANHATPVQQQSTTASPQGDGELLESPGSQGSGQASSGRAKSSPPAPPRAALVQAVSSDEISDKLRVKKIIYFDSGDQEEVKAAHINDWVYREGEELVDFSTGNRIAFRVARIEPQKVLLKNQTRELLLTLEEATSGAL